MKLKKNIYIDLLHKLTLPVLLIITIVGSFMFTFICGLITLSLFNNVEIYLTSQALRVFHYVISVLLGSGIFVFAIEMHLRKNPMRVLIEEDKLIIRTLFKNYEHSVDKCGCSRTRYLFKLLTNHTIVVEGEYRKYYHFNKHQFTNLDEMFDYIEKLGININEAN